MYFYRSHYLHNILIPCLYCIHVLCKTYKDNIFGSEMLWWGFYFSGTKKKNQQIMTVIISCGPRHNPRFHCNIWFVVKKIKIKKIKGQQLFTWENWWSTGGSLEEERDKHWVLEGIWALQGHNEQTNIVELLCAAGVVLVNSR